MYISSDSDLLLKDNLLRTYLTLLPLCGGGNTSPCHSLECIFYFIFLGVHVFYLGNLKPFQSELTEAGQYVPENLYSLYFQFFGEGIPF